MEMEIENKDLKLRFNFAMSLIKKISSNIISFYQTTDIDIKAKKDESLVTKVDKESEIIARTEIKKYFSNDGIIGEEMANNTKLNNEFIWTLDPIDGTYSFAHGVPLFGSMIGLIQNKEIVFGIVSFPALNEIVYAIKGGGTYWKKANSNTFIKSKTKSTKEVSKAILCYTDKKYFIRDNCLDLLDKLSRKTYDTKTWGDCFGNIMVATGRSDIMIDPTLSIWDVVPLKLIIEESGGLFIDRKTKKPVELDLTKIEPNTYNAISVCSKELLKEIL
ncbi:inositol monophosphatase family protein [Pseudomonadota bacterium]